MRVSSIGKPLPLDRFELYKTYGVAIVLKYKPQDAKTSVRSNYKIIYRSDVQRTYLYSEVLRTSDASFCFIARVRVLFPANPLASLFYIPFYILFIHPLTLHLPLSIFHSWSIFFIFMPLCLAAYTSISETGLKQLSTLSRFDRSAIIQRLCRVQILIKLSSD